MDKELVNAIVDKLWEDSLTIEGVDISEYENSIRQAINERSK